LVKRIIFLYSADDVPVCGMRGAHASRSIRRGGYEDEIMDRR
jgi:hypothetical protein